MKKKLLIFFAILPLLLRPVPVWSAANEGLKPLDGRLRMSFERLSLPGGEHMGFAGGTFLYDIDRNFSLGMGAYGALTGARGGFITLGFASEFRKKLLGDFFLSSGLFVGAGGGRGGFTLQGGGLMLRPHLGLHFEGWKWGSVGLGLSHIRFPNGKIRSSQAYFSYAAPFHLMFERGWREKATLSENLEPQVPASERAFAAVYRTYFVPKGVLTDGGLPQHKSLQLLGVEWERYLDEHFFLKIESGGAMGGESTGYMQILLGGGYRWRFMRLSRPPSRVKIATQIGVAGGGSVSTGGGLLADVSIGFQEYLTDRLYVGLRGAYADAPDGDFHATSLSLQLGYGYGVPVTTKKPVKYAALSRYKPQHLRLRAVHQSYFKAISRWRRHHANQNVNLLGLQADYFFDRNVYVSGQGIAAYSGNAGAYMTGLWGLGYHFPLFQTPLFVEFEGLVGAAGGGGLDVAGGLVWQSNAGLGVQLSPDFSLIGSAGYMSAPKGHFRAKVLGLALAYRFSLFVN